MFSYIWLSTTLHLKTNGFYSRIFHNVLITSLTPKNISMYGKIHLKIKFKFTSNPGKYYRAPKISKKTLKNVHELTQKYIDF